LLRYRSGVWNDITQSDVWAWLVQKEPNNKTCIVAAAPLWLWS
jgi:hypothetical protein